MFFCSEKYNKRAFTLVEILVAMSISVVVITSIYMLFSSSTKTITKTGLQSQMLADTRILIDRMVRELRQAKSIVLITPSKIVFEMYDSEDPGLFGVVGTKRISYVLETDGRDTDRFVRLENNSSEKPLFHEDIRIKPDIFTAYVEEEKGFKEFRWKENFSEDRKRITLINVDMNITAVKDKYITANVNSSVSIRHIHNRMTQPDWKYSVE
jgi:prepilin-type N-terminal cleavage/methylation domain-containing protein